MNSIPVRLTEDEVVIVVTRAESDPVLGLPSAMGPESPNRAVVQADQPPTLACLRLREANLIRSTHLAVRRPGCRSSQQGQQLPPPAARRMPP